MVDNPRVTNALTARLNALPPLPPSALARDLSGRVPLPALSPSQLGTWRPAALLPIEENSVSGQRRPALPGALQSIIDALMTPGNALQGRFPPQISDGQVDPYSNLIPPAMNMASSVMLGAGVVPKPKGSLGMGGSEAFDSLLSQARARIVEREGVVQNLLSSGKTNVPFEGASGFALAGPDMSVPGGYRLTYFDKNGVPNGHSEFKSMREALSRALLDGFKPRTVSQP